MKKTISNKLGQEICLFWLIRQAQKLGELFVCYMEGVGGRFQVTLAATSCAALAEGRARGVNSRCTHARTHTSTYTRTHRHMVKICTVTVYSARTANCSCGTLLRISAPHITSYSPFLARNSSSLVSMMDKLRA